MDGFEDLFNRDGERDEYHYKVDDDGDFVEDSQTSQSTNNRTPNRNDNAHNNRPSRSRSDASTFTTRNNNYRDNNTREGNTIEKTTEGQTPDGHEQTETDVEPEPSIDDLLISPPPEWSLCCVCHEVSSLSYFSHFHIFIFSHINIT